MRTADSWCDAVFREPWQKSDTVALNAGEANQLFRRIQASVLAEAADICLKVQRADVSNDCEDCVRAILAEADKLEL